MDTAIEVLFKAMLRDGWFAECDGDCDSHVNAARELYNQNIRIFGKWMEN